jgi:hypothetical protein
MKMVFVVGMFIRKFWNCTSPSTLRLHPKVSMFSFIVGYFSKIYLDGQKQEKKIKKLHP